MCVLCLPIRQTLKSVRGLTGKKRQYGTSLSDNRVILRLELEGLRLVSLSRILDGDGRMLNYLRGPNLLICHSS